MPKHIKHIHERRKITFAEYGALLGTRAMLEAQTVVFTPTLYAKPNCHLFNMGQSLAQEDCGTTGCIGGHMALIMGQHAGSYIGSEWMYFDNDGKCSPSLIALFYPPRKYAYMAITAKQAVKAIDNWLKTGRPGWSKLGLKKGDQR